MAQENQHEIDNEDVRLLDDLIITIDIENNTSVDVPLPQFNEYKIGKFSQSLWHKTHYLSDYYIPKVLLLGPCLDNLFHGTDELKKKFAARFIKSFSKVEEKESLLGKSLLKEIRNNIKALKKCFDEQALKEYFDKQAAKEGSGMHVLENFNDGILARLLFVDGCAILQFMHSYLLDELEKKFGIDNYQANRIQGDLFLLDNQIPFRVIELLVNKSTNPDELKKVIVNFLHINNMMASVNYVPGYKNCWTSFIREIKGQDHTHLLDLLHRLIVYGNDAGCCSNITKCLHRCYDQQKKSCCLPHFNSFCWKRSGESHRNYDERFFGNLQELKSAGIGFEPCSGLATVSFKTRFFNSICHLELPPITVDESTECKLMNLVAYERCFGGYKNQPYFVNSYIKLMDFLIDEEKDVQVLRASRTLWNHLSTDVKVAELFNNIGSKCSKPPIDVYLNMRTLIEVHCEKKCSIMMSQGYVKYFSSPWSAIALFASILLLIWTAIQTGYAVASYHKSQ